MLCRGLDEAILEPHAVPRPCDGLLPPLYSPPEYWLFGRDLVTTLLQIALAARVFINN
jgi:hypothetical protein